MKELTEQEKEDLESLLNLKPALHNGYFHYCRNGKRFKRSRVHMQIHINKKLDMWEIVHHKNGDKTDDFIGNLEVMDTSKHASLHHAGKRDRKTTRGDFYKRV